MFLCYPWKASEQLQSGGDMAFGFSQHWVSVLALLRTGWMALGKSLHLFKTYFPHLWKKHNTVPGGVLVRTKCLVHAKYLIQDQLGAETQGIVVMVSELLPWLLSSVDGAEIKAEGVLLSSPWALLSVLWPAAITLFASPATLPLCSLDVRQA